MSIARRTILKAVTTFAAALIIGGCGGGGGGGSAPPPPSPPPPPPAQTVTVSYLRAEPAYDGWGLHLWGNAIDASVATTWNAARMPDRIENGAAVFEIPVVDRSQPLNFIAHNGDLKSPIYDLSMTPQSFGNAAWIVQDEVASLNGNIGVPFDNETAALAALAALGNKSAALDLSDVTAQDSDSGLDTAWASSASFIEIYVRGYQDSDGDGIGDFQGLISRLDYLQGLGITGIWLMPITESADNDHGYAVEDYRDVESDYGTMADFELMIDEAHARGIAIIIDYVMNHAASTNPLFLDATTTDSNDKRDWFVWSDTRPTGWNTFAGDPWRNNGNGWYYGVFSAMMPDFNLRNPDVVAYHEDNLRFWLNKGVDGFRFDAVSVLFENGPSGWNNQPENHTLLGDTTTIISGYSKRYQVCEAPDDPAAYAAPTSCGRAFAFQSTGAILNSARIGRVEAGFANQLSNTNTDNMPLFLSNHDSFAGARVWNQFSGNEDEYKLAAASYLLASRTPFTYYGEEIGLANALMLSGDHSLRTPMSWTGDTSNAGFTTGTPFRNLSANVATHNVSVETGDGTSLLEYYRGLYQLRQAYPVIGAGTLDVQSNALEPVLLLNRAGGGATAVVAINYDTSQQVVTSSTGVASTAFDAVYGTTGQLLSDGAGELTLTVPARSAIVYFVQQ